MNNQALTTDLQPNNRNLVLVSVLCAIAALAVLCSVLAYLLWLDFQKEETDRLGAFSAPVILNRVPGQNGPAARMGEVVTYRGERCAVTTTVVETTVFYQATASRSIPGERFTSTLVSGCSSPTQQVAMPESVTAGTWALSGIVRDQRSGEVRYWTSQEFQVVP